jgi:hypothetical protein
LKQQHKNTKKTFEQNKKILNRREISLFLTCFHSASGKIIVNVPFRLSSTHIAIIIEDESSENEWNGFNIVKKRKQHTKKSLF